MKRTIAAATLLFSLTAAASAFAQYPPQQYPPQQYPPQQGYPQQGYPQQQYQQPGYQQAPMAPVPQSYAPPAASSGAAPIGSPGQIFFSADRLFGLSFWSSKTDQDGGVTDTVSGTDINLLWGDSTTPYSTPRLGLDFVVAQGFTVGGSIAFINKTGKFERSGGGFNASADTPTTTAFALAPRLGYLLPVNPMIGFWFKGGITYFSSKTEAKSMTGTSSTTVTGLAFNIEPELIITPVPHFGLTVGAVGDIGLSGTTTFQPESGPSTDHATKVTNFGIIAGILGYI
jgi:hypothetical protein